VTKPEPEYKLGYEEFMIHFLEMRTADTHASFFTPHLRPQMKLLDCGRGPGVITIDFAKLVSPGEVVGIDKDKSQVDRAVANASKRDVRNVRFQEGSINELPFEDNTFDAVFGQAVLSYVADPHRAMREVFRVTRPGGVVGFRDIDLDGVIRNPKNPIIAAANDNVFSGVLAAAGGDPHIGLKLRGIFVDTGFARVKLSGAYEIFSTPEEMATMCRWFECTFVFMRDGIAKLGIEETEVERIKSEIAGWQHKPNAACGIPWFECVGWKE